MLTNEYSSGDILQLLNCGGATIGYSARYVGHFPVMRSGLFHLEHIGLCADVMRAQVCHVVATDKQGFDMELITQPAVLNLHSGGVCKSTSFSVARA
jgi:hypothetical protein